MVTYNTKFYTTRSTHGSQNQQGCSMVQKLAIYQFNYGELVITRLVSPVTFTAISMKIYKIYFHFLWRGQLPNLSPTLPLMFPLKPCPFPLKPRPFTLKPRPFPLKPHPFDLKPHLFPLKPCPFPLKPHPFHLTSFSACVAVFSKFSSSCVTYCCVLVVAWRSSSSWRSIVRSCASVLRCCCWTDCSCAS